MPRSPRAAPPGTARRLVFDKGMGITHGEFLRVLPRFMEGRDWRVEGNRVRVEDGNRRIDITLTEERHRRIALMAVPVMRVRLAFSGYDADQARRLVARFERHFQRGGG